MPNTDQKSESGEYQEVISSLLSAINKVEVAVKVAGDIMGTPIVVQPKPAMDLRDFFAGCALQSLVMGDEFRELAAVVNVKKRAATVASDAYLIADAMMAEHEARKEAK